MNRVEISVIIITTLVIINGLVYIMFTHTVESQEFNGIYHQSTLEPPISHHHVIKEMIRLKFDSESDSIQSSNKKNSHIISNKNFIIHINNVNTFSDNFSGSGFRFGMAVPLLCPIGPVIPNLLGILGKNGVFNLNSTNPYNISSFNVSNTISSAFSLWSDGAMCDQFDWKFSGIVSDSSDILIPNTKNDILFHDLENPSVLAITILWLSEGRIVEGDIIINSNIGRHSISILGREDSVPGFNFFDIILHEIGHFIGLGHSNNIPICELAVMFPSIPINFRKEQLSETDREAVGRLFRSQGVCSSSYTNLNSVYITSAIILLQILSNTYSSF